MLSFGKLVDLGSAAVHVYVSEYLRIIDSRLFNRIQSPSHCLSHLLPPENHHLGLRPRGHGYACPNSLCKRSFVPRCLFRFLWSLNGVAVAVSALSHLTFAFVICHDTEISYMSELLFH